MPYEYHALVDRVVDGDTFDMLIDLGFGTYRKDRFRLLNVDTPEIYGVKKDSEEYALGMACSVWVREFLAEHCEHEGGLPIVRVKTHKDKKGKYGRYLADIYIGELCLNKAIRDFVEAIV